MWLLIFRDDNRLISLPRCRVDIHSLAAYLAHAPHETSAFQFGQRMGAKPRRLGHKNVPGRYKHTAHNSVTCFLLAIISHENR